MDQKEASKKIWALFSEKPTIEEINSGSLQRIAGAVEKMAERHTELIDECSRYKNWLGDEEKKVLRLEHKCAAYKGVITKLKKKQDLPF